MARHLNKNLIINYLLSSIIIFDQAPEQELPGMDFDVVNQQKVNFIGKVKISETRKGQLPLCSMYIYDAGEQDVKMSIATVCVMMPVSRMGSL